MVSPQNTSQRNDVQEGCVSGAPACAPKSRPVYCLSQTSELAPHEGNMAVSRAWESIDVHLFALHALLTECSVLTPRAG